MDITDLVSPITSSDWDQRQFSNDQGTFDGDLDFLGYFDTESDVTVVVSNGNDGLESGSLTSLSLFLD